MQDGNGRTETQTNTNKHNTSVDMDGENNQRYQEKLSVLPIDTRIKINTIPLDKNGKIEYLTKLPVPVIDWEINLSLYERGILFFTKIEEIGSITIKLVKFFLAIQEQINYIKKFISERKPK